MFWDATYQAERGRHEKQVLQIKIQSENRGNPEPWCPWHLDFLQCPHRNSLDPQGNLNFKLNHIVGAPKSKNCTLTINNSPLWTWSPYFNHHPVQLVYLLGSSSIYPLLSPRHTWYFAGKLLPAPFQAGWPSDFCSVAGTTGSLMLLASWRIVFPNDKGCSCEWLVSISCPGRLSWLAE